MTRNELIDLIARQTNEYRAQLESYLDTYDQYARLTSEQNELRYALANEHSERERIKLNRLIKAIGIEQLGLYDSMRNDLYTLDESFYKHKEELRNAIQEITGIDNNARRPDRY